MLSQMLFAPIVYALFRKLGKITTWKYVYHRGRIYMAPSLTACCVRIGAALIVTYGVAGFFLTSLESIWAFVPCIFLFGCGLCATNVSFNVFTSDVMYGTHFACCYVGAQLDHGCAQ